MNLPALFDPVVGWQITLALFHVSWLGLAVAGLAAAGNWCLRKRPASQRHALSFAALLVLGLSLPATLTYVRLTAPRSRETRPVASVASSVSTATANAPPSNPVDSLSSHVPAWFDLRANSQTIAILYLLGVAAMLAKFGVSIYGAQRLRDACCPVADRQLLEIVARQCQRLGLRLVPVVGCCERVAVPVVLGLVRPMILLPAAMLTGLDAEQLAAVLTHELAHIRRYDHLLIIVQRLIEALLFFHPAVWYLSRCVHQERENCCDDLVLAAGSDRLGYCLSLLRVAEMRLAGGNRRERLTVLAIDGEQPSWLRRRIARLLGAGGEPAIPLTRSGLLVGALLALLAAGVYFSLHRPSRPDHAKVRLVPGRPEAVVITSEALASLGIHLQTVKAVPPATMRCPGALALDSSHLARVKSRFSGEVVEVGSLVVDGEQPAAEASQRELRSGDHVSKGEILAIVSRYDVDENKRAPVDTRPDPSSDNRQTQTEIRSPIDGVIVERNVAHGEIVDQKHALFQIADMSQLLLMVSVNEEDLPALQSLPSEKRKWRIDLRSESNGKPIEGTFDRIGQFVDPGSHTAVVTGQIDNREMKFRAGQFITATIELPADPSLVVIPSSALIDEGHSAAVFVETDADQYQFTRRKVCVRRRDANSVFIGRQPTDDERERGFETLHAGERVMVSGLAELAAELKNSQ